MIFETESLDSQVLRDTFAHFPSGVAAMTAEVDGVAHALVASSFTVGVSLEPALVMFAVQKSSQTWPILKNSPRVGVSILGKNHADLCRQLAGSDKTARFADIEVHRLESGALLLPNACGLNAASTKSTRPVITMSCCWRSIRCMSTRKPVL